MRRFRDFAAEFGTPNFLVIVFEGDSPEQLAAAVDRVAARLEAVPGVRSVMSRNPKDESLVRVSGENPYLASADGELYFVFVRPEDDESRAGTIAPMVDGVREVLERSDLDALGVRAGLTGLPAYAIDDRDVIRDDISRLSLVSLAAILALFTVAFGALRRPLLVMVALVAGVAAVLGVIVLYPGHLTLLSAFFASILFGLGVDYGIHIVDRVEEAVADGQPEREAVDAAIVALAPGLATSALTTASVFFAMQLSGFRGFAELGAIAGTGVLVCLLAMTTVLPALLVLLPARAARERTLGERRLGRLLLLLQHRPLAWGLALASLAGALLGPPAFDSDYLNLQPADSEAVRLEREMVSRSEYSPQFAAFTVDSLEEVRSLSE
ncbi:MAG: MMPL family transporter, partial [Thermoanaerobaculia bacterium]|nr:MMPL family transporter [Thermoanaerobaculia bacterium]